MTGPHAIYVGVHYGSGPGFVSDRILQLKLSSDASFSRIMNEGLRPVKDGNYPEKIIKIDHISEAFWKVADLQGQDLIISGPMTLDEEEARVEVAYSIGTAAEQEANIAYVRLVPLDAAAAEFEKEQPREDTKRLIGNYDGWNLQQWIVSTPEDFIAEFECLRDSDFDIALYAMAYGPITFYPSKVGEVPESDGAYGIGKAVQRLLAKGIDPLKQAIVAAHDCGVKLFPPVSIRRSAVPHPAHPSSPGGPVDGRSPRVDGLLSGRQTHAASFVRVRGRAGLLRPHVPGVG